MNDYHLTVTALGKPVLIAKLHKEPEQQMKVTEAWIDNDADGLTVQGMDAVRCLALGELVISMALGVSSEDPFAEQVRLLEKELLRLRQTIQALEGMSHAPV